MNKLLFTKLLILQHYPFELVMLSCTNGEDKVQV